MALWVIAVVCIYAFITSKVAFGRYFYAVGGNEKAAKLSGINTKKAISLRTPPCLCLQVSPV